MSFTEDSLKFLACGKPIVDLVGAGRGGVRSEGAVTYLLDLIVVDEAKSAFME